MVILRFDAIALAEEPAFAGAGQMQDRFAQGFGRDGAGVDGRAAQHVVLLDDGDFLAELGRLNGRLLPGRAAPNDRCNQNAS